MAVTATLAARATKELPSLDSVVSVLKNVWMSLLGVCLSVSWVGVPLDLTSLF